MNKTITAISLIGITLFSQNASAAIVTEQWDARVTGTRNLGSAFLIGDTFSFQVSYEDSTPAHSNINFSGAIFDDIKTHSVGFHSEFNIGTNDNRHSTGTLPGPRSAGFNKDFQLNFFASNSINPINNTLSYKYNLLFSNGGVGAVTSEIKFAVTNVAAVSAVPVPAAAWLFGSGLLALVGAARRKTA